MKAVPAWTNYVVGGGELTCKDPQKVQVVSWDGDKYAGALMDGLRVAIPVHRLYASKQLKDLADVTGLPKPEKRLDYPKPSVTVDGVVFGLSGVNEHEVSLKILLIQRKNEPFKGRWALPGGFVDDMDECLEAAICRELEEETHATGLFLEQLATFGDPDRDPRGRVISVAYLALVNPDALDIQEGSDASAAQWFDVTRLPKLAFDHNTIIKVGLTRLEGKVRYQPIGFELLPKEFTLGQLQQMYEAILRRPLDKRNFRKKILAMGILTPLNRTQKSVDHRPALLYSFDRTQYKRLVKQGFNFEI